MWYTLGKSLNRFLLLTVLPNDGERKTRDYPKNFLVQNQTHHHTVHTFFWEYLFRNTLETILVNPVCPKFSRQILAYRFLLPKKSILREGKRKSPPKFPFVIVLSLALCYFRTKKSNPRTPKWQHMFVSPNFTFSGPWKCSKTLFFRFYEGWGGEWGNLLSHRCRWSRWRKFGNRQTLLLSIIFSTSFCVFFLFE